MLLPPEDPKRSQITNPEGLVTDFDCSTHQKRFRLHCAISRARHTGRTTPKHSETKSTRQLRHNIGQT